MELSDIAAVAGKGGLFKIVQPTRSGLILEGMEDNKRIVTGPNHRVSILSDISIYTTEYEKTVPLDEAFKAIYEEFGEDPGVDKKSDNDELFSFIKHIIPDYDPDRVYASDIKKLITWYRLIYNYDQELLKGKPEEDKKVEAKEKEVEKKEEKAENKKTTSKTTKK